MSPSQPAAPIDPRMANSAGMAALRAGDFGAARAHFARAADADPAASALWRNLAHACRELGDDAGEAVALDQAVTADRTDFAAWLRKAQLHQRRGEEALAFHAWSGTLQLAAGLPAVSPALEAELAIGADYIGRLKQRLDAGIESGLGESLLALP